MFTSGKNVELTDLGGGVKRKILAYGDDMMSVEVHFEEGAVGAMHTHPHVQISYVIDGEFTATIGDETKTIAKGDTYYTLPNVPHGVVCTKKGVLLDIFTPKRDDFLK
ncbi:MAG: cupin domain-containing protein [Ruminococcaceae bacterium]|nr:cupin domain-containing protein [Oscillospiraceae bacterium]